ncbi:cupin 2, conserved barrel [Rhypophila sp. PSN 637]
MPATIPSTEDPVPANNLPPPRRVITTHTPSGSSIFDTALPAEIPIQVLDPSASAALAYVSQVPITTLDSNTSTDNDITKYTQLLQDPPGLTIRDSTVLRSYDMAPGVSSPLHRTTSVDYLVVLYGEMELTLDSGQTRRIKAGEVVIQRGTMHSWKNVSEGWARMLAVTIPVGELIVGGEKKGEELGGIEGLKDSE